MVVTVPKSSNHKMINFMMLGRVMHVFASSKKPRGVQNLHIVRILFGQYINKWPESGRKDGVS